MFMTFKNKKTEMGKKVIHKIKLKINEEILSTHKEF